MGGAGLVLNSAARGSEKIEQDPQGYNLTLRLALQKLIS